MKHCLIVLVCLLFPLSLMCKETRETGQNADKRYEEIVKSVKDNPGQALADLKKLADKNRFAAMEYLILLSIYEPQKVNTPEFEQIARRLHTDVVAQYKKLVPDSPFYGIYQGQYEGLIKDDYLKCYKDLSCLIEIGALNFSKFFSVWGDVSGDMLYVPWKIVVPCPTAQKLHLTAVLDSAGGGHGAETLDISNCGQYPQYDFPDDVEEYRNYIQRELELDNPGSIRYVYMAGDVYKNIVSHYDPDWNFERSYGEKEYLQALPLEAWAMESYPNYKYFSEVVNHGIGFDKAVDKLTRHYVKTFKVDEGKARQYARYVMIPRAAASFPVNRETLRYKILSGVPAEEIKAWIEDKKLKGEEFAEPETPHQADEILMVSVHRPDVLKMLIETCPDNEEKLSCFGLNTDVDAGNAFGKTALMYAAQYGFAESVKILLEAGADINAQTNKGYSEDAGCWENICLVNGERTALMYAVQEGNLEIAKYLADKGADINLKDSKGMSVYDYLSGKAPYLGNFKYSPTSVDYDFSPPEKHENKNVTPEQADDFIEFLKNVFKSPAALSEFTV